MATIPLFARILVVQTVRFASAGLKSRSSPFNKTHSELIMEF